jgi:hypothetical protein
MPDKSSPTPLGKELNIIIEEHSPPGYVPDYFHLGEET